MALRNDPGEGSVEHLAPAPPEHALRLCVPVGHPSLGVDADDCIEGVLDDEPRPQLAFLAGRPLALASLVGLLESRGVDPDQRAEYGHTRQGKQRQARFGAEPTLVLGVRRHPRQGQGQHDCRGQQAPGAGTAGAGAGEQSHDGRVLANGQDAQREDHEQHGSVDRHCRVGDERLASVEIASEAEPTDQQYEDGEALKRPRRLGPRRQDQRET